MIPRKTYRILTRLLIAQNLPRNPAARHGEGLPRLAGASRGSMASPARSDATADPVSEQPWQRRPWRRWVASSASTRRPFGTFV